MKHASEATLAGLGSLLQALRRQSDLKEKKSGVFYLRSRAFLHFHEDPTGIFADVRLGEDFTRMRATTRDEQRALLAAVDSFLKGRSRG